MKSSAGGLLRPGLFWLRSRRVILAHVQFQQRPVGEPQPA
jgi:hypothetical protein